MLLSRRAVGEPRQDPARRPAIARLARYGATSAVAFAISEITLLVLYGSKTTGATVAAIVANLVGTVPSYLISRYWIWNDAPRTRAGRQVAMYWATSIICIAGTSLATGAIASLVPPGHRFHVVIAGVGFLVVNIVFWLAKFAVYQQVIFPVHKPTVDVSTGRVPIAGPAPASCRASGGMSGPGLAHWSVPWRRICATPDASDLPPVGSGEGSPTPARWEVQQSWKNSQ
jgi:putative flippase GtrA